MTVTNRDMMHSKTKGKDKQTDIVYQKMDFTAAIADFISAVNKKDILNNHFERSFQDYNLEICFEKMVAIRNMLFESNN